MRSHREIPLNFISQQRALTWREVLIGVQEHWLSATQAVELAIDRMQKGDDNPSVLALSCLLREEADLAEGLLEELVNESPGNSESAGRQTWMRLLVAWAFENRATLPDPLGVLEEIYADFDYAPELRHLIRYEPQAEDVGAPVGAEALLRGWEEYVQRLRNRRD